MVTSFAEFNVKRRVDILKLAIQSLTSKYPSDNYNKIIVSPVDYKKIWSFDDYPADYKLFLRTIGTISIGTNDCHALEILTPQHEEQYPDLYGECEMWWGYNPEKFPQHVRVGILPCDYESVGFDIRSKPFEFVSFNTTEYDDFLDFVENQFAENPTLVPHFKSAQCFYH